jgi:hypothetical protein
VLAPEYPRTIQCQIPIVDQDEKAILRAIRDSIPDTNSRSPVRNDFGTLAGACYDFMSLSICAICASTADLSWTVFPVANWGGMAEFKYGPLSFKIGDTFVKDARFDWRPKGMRIASWLSPLRRGKTPHASAN